MLDLERFAVHVVEVSETVDSYQDSYHSLVSSALLSRCDTAWFYEEGKLVHFYWQGDLDNHFGQINKWATDAIYVNNAHVTVRSPWIIGDLVRGPVLIMRDPQQQASAVRTIIGASNANENILRSNARDALSGFWFTENDFDQPTMRYLYAENDSDLVIGKMIFA